MKTPLLLSASLVTFLAVTTGCTITTTPDPSGATSPSTDPVSPSPSPVVVDAGAGASGCGFGEPNDTRDLATPIALGSAYTGVCLSGRNDLDWLQFTAPADAAGGYVKVVVSNVHGTSVGVKAYAQATNREVANVYSATSGESLTAYFTVAPGAKYNVEIAEFSGDGEGAATYDVKVVYTRFEDAFEANETRDDAKSLTAGMAIEANLVALAGPSVPKNEDADDWYKVELPAGRASVKIEHVPTNVSVEYEIRNAGGTVVDSAYRATEGESLLRSDIEIAAAGTYYVRVGTFNHVENAGKGEVMPDNFTRRYSLLVASQ